MNCPEKTPIADVKRGKRLPFRSEELNMSTNIQTTAIRQIESAAAWTPRARRIARRSPAIDPASFENMRRSGDRRGSHRYSIDLPVQYEIGRGDLAQSGKGRVINMSSTGLLVESDGPVGCGTPVRLRVEWPARLNNSVPLSLHIEGRAVRAKGTWFAVRIMKSEFRIRPHYALEAVRRAG